MRSAFYIIQKNSIHILQYKLNFTILIKLIIKLNTLITVSISINLY